MPLPRGIEPRLTELGKIKIGGLGEERKSRGGGTYRLPQKNDYFTIAGCDRDRSGRLVEDTAAMDSLVQAGLTGSDGRLRQLPIYLLSDDPDEVLQAAYVYYDGKSRIASCDGDILTRYYRTRTERLDHPVEEPCRGEHEGKGWKLHTNFSCVLASGAARFGGVYRFRTTSVITTSQLYGGLLHIQTLTGGILTGIPLRLVIRPLQVAPDGKTTTVYVVHVEIHATDLADVQRQALNAASFRAQHHRQIQAAQRQYVALLKAPGDEEPEEIADLVEEFHPTNHILDERAQDPPQDDPHRPDDPWAAPRTARLPVHVEDEPEPPADQSEEAPPPHDPETGEVYDREPGADEDEPAPDFDLNREEQ